MSGHTPGPWKAPTGDVTVILGTHEYDGERVIVASVRVPVDVDTHEALIPATEWQANARLIAAAPEMLEALEDLTVAAPNDPCWQRARAAIAKARGAR